MAVNFPSNPTNGQTITVSGITYAYDSTQGVWSDSPQGLTQAIDALTDVDTSTVAPTNGQVLQWNSTDSEWQPADSSAGVTVYATIDDLPLSGVAEGSMALVDSTDKLYIFSDAGWYSITLVNTTPSISGVSATYTLATDGTATVVTVTATDPEGLPLTYSIVSDTSGNVATVTQGTGSNTNVFTITPSTNTANAGTFSLTFRASDGVNIATAVSSFTLQFKVANSNYTTALITSVGANNAVNNSFTDSSTNSHTITANGNVTQGAFSPYRHGGYSIFCDGANVIDLGFSTLNSGNWTFECWALVETGSTILGKYGGGNQLESFGVSGTTGYMNTHTSVGGENPTCNTDLRDGKWHYLVWERYNGTYYYWADGSLEASFANSESPSATGNWVLGGVASSRFKGNIKEARFSLSTAVYSGSAPTTPTEPQTTSNATDAFFTGVGLEIKDYSSNNRSFTVPSTFESAPTTPYDHSGYSTGDNGGSVYFDGGSDYLTASPAAPSTGDFCYECWINVSQASDDAVLETRTANQSASGFTLTVLDASTIRIYSNNAKVTASNLSYLNQWTHLCVEKVGSTTTLYINGTSYGTTTDFTNMSDTTFRIGESAQYGAFSGHIADFRYVRGGYVYNGNFTPPTAPLTAITNTEFLLNGTNAGIIDKSQSVKTITLNGDVKSSTTQTKYLSSSMYFDGTGDYIACGSDNNFAMGAGDFTWEAWINFPSASAYRQIISTRATGGSSTAEGSLAVNPSNGLTWWTSTFIINYTTSIGINQWVHVAISRSGTTLRVFADGVEVGSTTNSNNLTGNSLSIGANGNGAEPFTGYISDVRITKGLARYTSNFTPPSAALQG